MRLLGIDYGEKNVGIALTDDKAMMAFPHKVIPNTKKLADKIEAIMKGEKVERVIIGESKDYKGEPNRIMKKIQSFKEDLLKRGLSVELEPEFMTSAQARYFTGETDMHDASAATIILQSYIDRKKHGK